MNSNFSRGRSFGPCGCQVPVGKGVCGEKRTLDIINQFKILYQKKMEEIDTAGGGDCLMEKLRLQQEWIGDLTEQNEMLVKAVEELEHEATERVEILEEKLQRSAQCLCEVMNKYRQFDIAGDVLAEPLEKVFRLENDQKNLLEFVRRIREDKKWCADGLNFFEISFNDLFGASFVENDEDSDGYLNSDNEKEEHKNKNHERTVNELKKKLDYFNSFGDVPKMANELKSKGNECESLKQEMIDMRQALTEEVASKHDIILQLKKECQQLEDRCIQADKHTTFRDDIIKELRKEVKQLKQQKCQCLIAESQVQKTKMDNLQKHNISLECKLKDDKLLIIDLDKRFEVFKREREELRRRCKISEKQCKCFEDENKKLEHICEELKVKVSVFIKDNDEYAAHKIVLEDELKCTQQNLAEVKNTVGYCSSKIDDLETENKKMTDELVRLNEENRNLMNTIECQKNKIVGTTKLTQDEIVKLNATVNGLQTKLQETKKVREEEEKCTREKIKTLNATIEELHKKLHEAMDINEHQAKEHLTEVTKLSKIIEGLNHKLKESEDKLKVCKMCKGRLKVGFVETAEVQTNMEEDCEEKLEKQMELLLQRDEIIKIQTDTLNVLQNELVLLKEQVMEKEKCCNEVNYLKSKIIELENELKDSEFKASNLQTAVDLYLNSINVLEASEEKYKIEINQQKATIANLQKAVVSIKQELECTKQKSEDNEFAQYKLINNFTCLMHMHEGEKEDLKEQIFYLSDGYEHLQDLNFELELEHCDSLQDVDILENQLYKYKILLKCEENDHKQCKCQLKKLAKHKKCYEEIIAYFKQEMTIMSDQLVNLQELLTLSHTSIQEENNRLQAAFLNIQAVNEQLSYQLTAAEQKMLLENQMNQLNETKISDLEKLISEKEIDLTRHDRAIMNIRQSLQCSLKQNEDLHSTIVALNGTILQLQSAIKKYELDNNKSRETNINCQNQIDCCKQKLEVLKCELEKKSAELCNLEMAYNNQNRTLKSAQVELKEMRNRQKEKQSHLKAVITEWEEKYNNFEDRYNELLGEYHKLEAELSDVSKKENAKDAETQRYRKIIADLKNMMIDLNKELTKREYTSKCQSPECKKYAENIDKTKHQDIHISCPCEAEFYKSIVDSLKTSVVDLRNKLADTQQKNVDLEERCKCTETRYEELSQSQQEKDREYKELHDKLTEKLLQTQFEESRYTELSSQFEKELNTLRQELEIRNKQLNDVKRSAQEINSSRCIQLACAQDEVNNLKEEMNELLRKQCGLNVENERLHQQSAKMQTTISGLEEKSLLLKGQLEKYLSDLQNVQSEKECIIQKNCELLNELRSLQRTANKQQRYSNDSLKVLETELNEIKNNRDEICLESKNVINYFRAWLEEQRKINEYMVNKERDYNVTIEKLRKEYEDLQVHCQGGLKTQRRLVGAPHMRTAVTSPPPTCQSPWSLGSQGTASLHDDSPSRSPCFNEDCDWYSSNFRNYSDDDDDEEDWVSKVENLAAQVRKTNKMWKSKLGDAECNECIVSKDTKK